MKTSWIDRETSEIVDEEEKMREINEELERFKKECQGEKTSEEKGSKYSSTGGHVTHGEDGMTTILRELKEELGLDVKENEVETIALVKHPERPCLINLYLLEKELDPDTLKLQTEEVDSVEWMTKEEILSLIDDGKFLGSHGYLFKKYFNN